MKTVLLMTLIVLPLIGCTSSAFSCDQSADTSAKLVAFGDSFTWGEGVANRNDAYIYKISQALGLSVDNKAKGGSRTWECGQLKSIQTYPFQDGQIVVMMFGYNDSRSFKNMSRYSETFHDELVSAISHALTKDTIVFIGNCIVTSPEYYISFPEKAGLNWDLNCNELANITRQVVVEFNNPRVTLVDTNTMIQMTSDSIASDKMHPNELGALKISNAFLTEMF